MPASSRPAFPSLSAAPGAGQPAAPLAHPLIREAQPADAAVLAPLTAASLRWMLADDQAGRGVIRIAAFDGDTPVGLLLSCAAGAGLQELTSIMVTPGWRGRGVATMMLSRLTARLRRDGARGLFARWSSRLPRAAEFARLLAASGWSQPEVTRRRMTWRIGDWPDVFPNRDRVLARLERNGLVVRSLRELGEDGISEFKRQNLALIAAGRAPDWADMTGWVEVADPDVTVVLSDREGTVAGWMACVLQAPLGRWYIPQGWVVAEKVPQGWLVGGIASLCQRLVAKAGPDAMLIAQPPAGVPGGMERMLYRHFGTRTASTDFLFESEYALAEPDRTEG
ncbi:GNAT family N-acetyltransferase [Pannonibacter tanglangensis]|uniref:GNAT family N-acetyltransferase n=1 Tax=Pannonibacter tanglangensis TaxID=2750084 RepID=A0ABW9ZJM3_9HYPH|nr:GNAT family N-acetyltransferase [Pannonibacter sp. XCT-34]NBN65093.1 GNAT family N-acetyltransferase [Pannonibacter sp. XCT-34]